MARRCDSGGGVAGRSYLGDVIQVEALRVEAIDSKLEITIRFLNRRTQERQIGLFSREV